MMKSVHMLFASMIAAATLVLGAHAAEPDPLAGLREKPNDTALLEKLKLSLAGVADTGERCRLGAVYCAGAMVYGDASAGLDMRAKMARAFPTSPYVLDLADGSIFDACSCVGGKTEAPCRKCAGNGTCASCNGTGKGKVKDFNGNDTTCLACKGGGKCGDCAGTGKVEKPCPACGGRGQALSKDKCRTIYLRLLGAQAAEQAQAAAAPASAAEPAPAAAAEPAQAAVAQTPKANPPTGKYKIPAVKPPVEGVADPEIKAAFDAMVAKELHQRLQEVMEKESRGWSNIGAVGKDRQELIDEYVTEMLTLSDNRRGILWDDATREVEERRREAKAERESKAREQAAQAQEQEAEKEKQGAQDRLTRAVEAALAAARAQASRMPVFSRYGITYADIAKANSRENTSVQRQQAFQELWDRARTCSDPNVRGLYMPFPSGLKYKVKDVKRQRSGTYLVMLTAVEESPKSGAGAMPKGTCHAVAKALAPMPVHVNLYSPTLKVPGNDAEVSALRVGDAMTSGDWIISVALARDGRMKAENVVCRNEDELDTVLEVADAMREQAAEAAMENPAAQAQPKPTAKCGQCGGNGRMKCDACNGTGKQVSSLPCSTCSGTGLFNGHRCPSCNGERFRSNPCRMCGGKGMSLCPFCGGDGQR